MALRMGKNPGTGLWWVHDTRPDGTHRVCGRYPLLELAKRRVRQILNSRKKTTPAEKAA